MPMDGTCRSKQRRSEDRSGCNEDQVNEEKNDTAGTSVNQKKDGHGCNECHKEDPDVTRIKQEEDQHGSSECWLTTR